MEFVCIGGDKRHSYMKKELISQNHIEKKFVSFNETFTGNETLILPIPSFNEDGSIKTLSDKSITHFDFIESTHMPKIIIGGMLSNKFARHCEKKSVKVYNITDRNDYAILNAVPTAEATIMIALEELPVSLWRLDILVTGYGRVSQILCDRLIALGANVTVAVRKAGDMAYAETRGASFENINNIKEIEKYRLIINTVPHLVLTNKLINKIRKDALVIDLASMPGGCDTQSLNYNGIKFIHALSLPGRTAPETAGKILAKIVLKIINEEEKT